MLRALRVSRLTICPLGQPEKAIGLEPQIEPWLAIYNHTACLRQKSIGVVYASAMNLRKRKITDPQLYELGWMAGRISSLPPVAGEVFLLTSPFIERAYRRSGSAQKGLVRLPDFHDRSLSRGQKLSQRAWEERRC